jgi:hypothetical protein
VCNVCVYVSECVTRTYVCVHILHSTERSGIGWFGRREKMCVCVNVCLYVSVCVTPVCVCDTGVPVSSHKRVEHWVAWEE